MSGPSPHEPDLNKLQVKSADLLAVVLNNNSTIVLMRSILYTGASNDARMSRFRIFVHGCRFSDRNFCLTLFWFKYVFVLGSLSPEEVKLDKSVRGILPVLFCWLSSNASFSLIKADYRALAKVSWVPFWTLYMNQVTDSDLCWVDFLTHRCSSPGIWKRGKEEWKSQSSLEVQDSERTTSNSLKQLTWFTTQSAVFKGFCCREVCQQSQRLYLSHGLQSKKKLKKSAKIILLLLAVVRTLTALWVNC